MSRTTATVKTNNQLVTQDNALIEACYNLTLNEKRLVLVGIGKIDSRRMPNRGKPLSFMVTAEEWKIAYPDSKNPYQEMKRAISDLSKKTVKFRKGVREDDDFVNWTDSGTVYAKGKGAVKLTFGYTISHYLQGVFEKFTSYDLLSVQKLNSVYSIRLFELLSQYKSTGWRTETLDNLRFSLGLTDSLPNWNDFNQQVLKRGIKEINEKSIYKVEHKPVKKGRKVVAVEFLFKENLQSDLFKKGK